MPPKDVHTLIPRTCGNVTLCGKKGFGNVFTLRILRWKVILDKVVHRDYDTGFFFDSPADDAKIDPDKSYNKPAFVVGVTEGSDPVKGLTKVIQKNKLYKGDTLNVLMPEGYMEPVIVSELYDAKMNPINDCPHPEMTFFMKAVSSADGNPVELPDMTFLSRDGDKDFGIPAPN